MNLKMSNESTTMCMRSSRLSRDAPYTCTVRKNSPFGRTLLTSTRYMQSWMKYENLKFQMQTDMIYT